MALADGRVIECDPDHDADLFWALRGVGGGNFGVVTSLVFDTVPAPQTTVFHLVWPFAHAAALAGNWQEWAPYAPEDIDATLRLAVGTDAHLAHVELIGAVLGTEADATRRLEAFVSRAPAPPASAWCGEMTYPAAKRCLDNLDQHRQSRPGGPDRPGHLYAQSEFFRQALDRQTLQALARGLTQPAAGARAREVTFMPWGGGYNQVAPDATAFPHRNELFLIQHLLEADPGTAAAHHGPARRWLSRSWSLAHRFGSGGAYPNFPDPELPDWGRRITARTTAGSSTSRPPTTPATCSGSTNRSHHASSSTAAEARGDPTTPARWSPAVAADTTDQRQYPPLCAVC